MTPKVVRMPGGSFASIKRSWLIPQGSFAITMALILTSCGSAGGRNSISPILTEASAAPSTSSPTQAPSTEPDSSTPGPATSEPSPLATPLTVRSSRSECRTNPDDRAAIAGAFFSAKDGPSPGYADALAALRTAGFPTAVTERAGPDRWDQFSFAAGTLAELLPAAARLEPKSPEYVPGVNVYCAGLVSLSDGLEVATTLDADIAKIIRRTGGHERVNPDGYNQVSANGRYRIWVLTTPDGRFVVERTAKFLADRDVLGAQPYTRCGGIPEDPPQPGCDLRPSER